MLDKEEQEAVVIDVEGTRTESSTLGTFDLLISVFISNSPASSGTNGPYLRCIWSRSGLMCICIDRRQEVKGGTKTASTQRRLTAAGSSLLSKEKLTFDPEILRKASVTSANPYSKLSALRPPMKVKVWKRISSCKLLLSAGWGGEVRPLGGVRVRGGEFSSNIVKSVRDRKLSSTSCLNKRRFPFD